MMEFIKRNYGGLLFVVVALVFIVLCALYREPGLPETEAFQTVNDVPLLSVAQQSELELRGYVAFWYDGEHYILSRDGMMP